MTKYDLSNLSPAAGSRKASKRVGRGPGSGLGKTSGRGHKGLRARSGGRPPVGFEGGQMPLSRRLPKFGFTNRFAKTTVIINVGDLNRFDEGTEVTVDLLRDLGIVKGKFDFVKLLGNGEVDKKLHVKVDRASQSARAKVERAGGVLEVSCG